MFLLVVYQITKQVRQDRQNIHAFILMIFTSVVHLSGRTKIHGNKLIYSDEPSSPRPEDDGLLLWEWYIILMKH